jgi:V/A-type H+-transporting ATPase subunit I
MVLPARGGDLWAVIIFLLGQLVLVGLEGLVVFIQSLRLTYYEFFTKFFEAAGKEFNPFSFNVENKI